MKILHLSLTDGQHRKLRVMAAERAVAMSELVRWWIDGNINESVKPVKSNEPGEVPAVAKAGPVKSVPRNIGRAFGAYQ